MTSFKDFVQSDIDNVFVNSTEFAETAIIEGVEMSVVMDTTANLQGDKKNQIAEYDIVFHVATSYFDEAPKSDNILNFNGKNYTIKHVDDVMGMLTIALSRNQS